MSHLERGQTDEERYQAFLDQEKKEGRGKISSYLRANLRTAWARITENEFGEPLEPGEPRFIDQAEK